MKVNWGILGVAQIAERLIPAIQQSKSGEVRALASRNLSKARKKAEEYGVEKFYGTYKELLLDQDVQAVYIPLPNHLHKEWLLESVKHNKHVLCEKPLTLTAKESQEMFEAGEENHVQVMEAFMYRFDPRIDKIKQILNIGRIGNIKYIDFNFSHTLEIQLTRRKDYRLEQSAGGGALYDLGVYGINLCNYLLDDQPKEILSCRSMKTNEKDIDRTSLLDLRYKDNILVHISVSFQYYSNYLQVAGTTGALEVSNIISQEEGELRIKKYKQQDIVKEQISAFNSYTAMVNHFNDCILHKKEPEVTKKQTIGTLKIVEESLAKMEILK